MSQTVTLNGVSYTVPEENDNNWGGYTTTYLVAIASNMLQKSGGAFNLTADVDFGSTYGLIAGYYKSASTNIASAGVVRLSNTDDIAFRNAANSGDLLLSADPSSDGILTYNSVALVTLSATQTLTNKTLTSPTLTSPVLNTSVSGTAIDTDLASVSSSDDTLASAKAIKTYVDAQVTAADLDFSGDSGGAQSVDLDSQSLTVEGGTGVDTTGSAQKISIAIDSTVATLTGSQALTNKTIDVDSNTVSNIEVDNLKSGVLDTDIAGGVSGSDDTIASAKAIKTYVDAQVTAADLDFSGDSGGAQSVDLDSQSLTVSGGTGIDTTGSAQTMTIAIDSTVATLTGSQSLTNKTIDVDSNTVSNIEVDNLKSGVLDTDIAGGVSSSDDTLASAKAIKTYVDAQVTAQDLDFSGDSGGAQSVDLDSQSLTVSGGTGIDTTGSAQTMTVAIDSTVATLAGSQTLTNKTLTGANVGTGKVTDYAIFDHQASDPGASPDSNDVFLYAKENKIYTKDSNDVVTELGAGGGGAGDADTIQLKAANDFSAVNVAPWYTGSNPVPGGGGSLGGTFELSTSNPLINTNNATKVFHYTNGTSNRKNDYFEIELDVPNYAKGKNLVVQLFYRTVGAEDTDFLFFARDRTADYETTTTSTGAQTTITLADDTGFAVGDRVCLQDSSDARHFRYVIAVDTSASTITFSGSAITFASGNVVVSKYFTDELNFISAENNTTNYEGKIRKWAFQINETTTKIRVGFTYDNTATSTNELFFDQILLSSNQFLQTSSKPRSGTYWIGQFTDEMDNIADTMEWDLSDATIRKHGNEDTLTKCLEVSNVSSVTRFTALQDCVFEAQGSVACGSTGYDSATIWHNKPDGTQYLMAYGSYSSANSHITHVSGSIAMKKGEYLFMALKGSNPASWTPPSRTAYSGDSPCIFSVTVTPQVSDCILLSSEDEIFSDWQDFTPSWSSGGFGTLHEARWRRDGCEMEVFVSGITGTTTAAIAYTELPSGYNVDISKFSSSTSTYHPVGEFGIPTINTDDTLYMAVRSDDYPNRIYFAVSSAAGYAYDTARNWNWFFSSSTKFFYRYRVPIQGWTSTFNPVLSMPLVDIGGNTEYFFASKDGGTAGYGSTNGAIPYFNSVNENSVSKLGTITNTAALGTYFTASQRVKVTANYFVHPDALNYFDVGWAKNLTSTEANTSIDSTPQSKKLMQNTGQYNHYSLYRGCSTTTVLEPGDSLWPQTAKESITANIGGISIVVERDFSHTNMAHIIKPAVAILEDRKAQSVQGGTNTDDEWAPRILNTIKGESWFVSGSFTGVGGTNTDFTLIPGYYRLSSKQCFYKTGDSVTRLYDITNSKAIGTSTSIYFEPSEINMGYSLLDIVFTVTANTTFRMQYYCKEEKTTNGLGSGCGITGREEVFAIVEIEKLK